MKLIIVAVKDRAMEAFMRPFFVPTVGMAIRSFQDEINRKDVQNPMFAHPEDYDLFALGTFDEESGVFDQSQGVRQVAIGKQMITNKGD